MKVNNNTLQLMIGAAFFLGTLTYVLVFGRKDKKGGKTAEIIPLKADNDDADLIAKKKIMSEIGKKGAAKSAEVRRAKKVKKEETADTANE